MTRFFILFLLLPLFAAAQIQPIIDNGYYSIQDWGGAIHPSGKFYVKADRSMVCARDVKTDVLIQTYHTPCIANQLYFTPDGKFLIIETLGELGELCQRVLIFDFYNGRKVYESKGRAIINYGYENYVYVNEHVNPSEGDSYAIFHKVYLSDSVYIESKSPLAEIDSVTVLTDKKGNSQWINKWVKKDYFTKSIFETDTTSGLNYSIDPYKVRERIKDYKFTYETRVVSSANYTNWAIAVNDLIFMHDSDENVILFSFPLNKELTIIDSVQLFNAQYLKNNHSLYLRNPYQTAYCKIDLKNLKKTNYPEMPYGNHYRIINDTLLSRVDVNKYQIDFGLTDFTRNFVFTYDKFSNPLTNEKLFRDGRYSSSIALRSNILMHDKNFIIDIDNKIIKKAKYFIDTNLIHPGVIGFSPDSLGLLMINEFTWNINSPNQLVKASNSRKTYFSSYDSSNYEWIKDINRKHQYLQFFPLYNYESIGYPTNYETWGSGEFRSGCNYVYESISNQLAYSMNFLLFNNNVHVVHDDSLLRVIPEVWIKNMKNYKSIYNNYMSKVMTTDNLSRINKLPEYTLYEILFNQYQGKYSYNQNLSAQKRNQAEWYYGTLHSRDIKMETKSTSDLAVAVNAFLRNIFTTRITLENPINIPFFQVSIIDQDNLPDITLAGIYAKNDVYFNTLNIPVMHDRIIGINYAHGLIQLKNKQNELISESSFYRNGEFIHVLPDGYYFASKSKLNKLSVRVDTLVYPVEQFDIKYNRPDIVLRAMGCTNESLMSAYKNAHNKRLKKLGFTEEMLKSDYHLPELKIIDADKIPLEIDSSHLELNLKMEDSKYELDRINVYVNDVPVYGSKGIGLRSEKVKVKNQQINIELAGGENKIQVSVLNQAGAESYKESVYIKYKPKDDVKPELFLVTIGDSKYKDSRFNLTYAAKDAADIKKVFEGNDQFNKINAFSLENEMVTKENILQLKTELNKARRDDVVIITVAGHGVLDDKLDYYLATYDMDFNNPSERGIPYEELESLVDGILPLKKVIFLDACHSGEVDKEEVEQLAVAKTSDANVKFRSAGGGIQKKTLGLKTSGELMSELFADLRKGTGATVISSAGGAEYAMESDQWKNGLFTYCLLHGLKDKAADKNKDGAVMLSELQEYLRKEVSDLSNGAQRPTSRIENMSMDFRLW